MFRAFLLISLPAHQFRNAIMHDQAIRKFSMASATVKWFDAIKGYGFIQPDAGEPDVFVHVGAVERASLNRLAERQKLGYELQADRRTGKTSADQLKLV